MFARRKVDLVTMNVYPPTRPGQFHEDARGPPETFTAAAPKRSFRDGRCRVAYDRTVTFT